MGISLEKALPNLAASSFPPCLPPPLRRREFWCGGKIFWSSRQKSRSRMSSATEFKPPAALAAQVQLTRRAARELGRLSTAERNHILFSAADLLEAREAEILEANRLDCETLS